MAKGNRVGPKVYMGTLKIEERVKYIHEVSAPVLTHPSELLLPTEQPFWVLYGDESTATSLVTYGIVGFEYPWQANAATFAFQRVMVAAGAPPTARVHCKELFSGDARKKTVWAHLTETQTWDLVINLVKALTERRAQFFLGLVYADTYPARIPAGKSRTIQFTNDHAYAFGFYAASCAYAAIGNKNRKSRYVLFIDEASSKADFWGIGNVQIRRMMSLSGLTPKTDNHLLLDAADIFAYASGRAFSSAPARNKAVCEEVVKLCRPHIGHYWWQAPSDIISPTMKRRLGMAQ